MWNSADDVCLPKKHPDANVTRLVMRLLFPSSSITFAFPQLFSLQTAKQWTSDVSWSITHCLLFKQSFVVIFAHDEEAKAIFWVDGWQSSESIFNDPENTKCRNLMTWKRDSSFRAQQPFSLCEQNTSDQQGFTSNVKKWPWSASEGPILCHFSVQGAVKTFQCHFWHDVYMCWQSSGVMSLLLFVGAEVFSLPLACLHARKSMQGMYFFWFKFTFLPFSSFFSAALDKKKTITGAAMSSTLASQHIAHSFFSFSLVKWTKIKISVISLLFWIQLGENLNLS